MYLELTFRVFCQVTLSSLCLSRSSNVVFLYLFRGILRGFGACSSCMECLLVNWNRRRRGKIVGVARTKFLALV